MIWSSRSFYAAALALASVPPLLSARIAGPPSTPVVVADGIGLTLGEDGGRRIVVTSLRSGGPADHGGIAVGDRLERVAGHPVAGLNAMRRTIHAHRPCAMTLTLNRDGISYDARIWQCKGRAGTGVRRASAR
ncbi:PDZ domain-containing protein [Sphingobium sp. HWE2-09]|uniref:PDZ domain-containing protein n=1 Tax=Sphingobium sp. HWE2-09 TaxID=3108390 RepID=UPI002DC9768C|nr:PDZ domain-containing protein [Sphingobium sp. HWE2-09]